ncbi:hypothetical protein FRC03_006803 [Tulasnella sp. 419]|nr:hypothetical protein FRC03_006803 [Tulasnella sp. 419]
MASTRRPTADSSKVHVYRAPPIPPKFGHGLQYWSEYLDLAQVHDQDFAGGLHKQLDSLLTFAGLFSGINTGFIVLSLDLLSPTPGDETNALLRLLLSQNNISDDILQEASEPWVLKSAGVRSSFFLSASLSFGLLTSVGAILGKQWLAYYERSSEVGSLEERVVKHQNLTVGVDIYAVRNLLYSLSLLIQIAVLLFLIGFIYYIYDLHKGVAGMVISLVLLGFVFYAYTVVAATLDPRCPFQTPVSLALRTLFLYLKTFSFSSNPDNHSDTSFPKRTSVNKDVESNKSDNGQRPRSVFDIIWMPFTHMVTARPLVPWETVKQKARVKKNDLQSYARSVRWILETSPRQEALMEAAKNMPTLQDVALTRTIFMQSQGDSGPLTIMSKHIKAVARTLLRREPEPETSTIYYQSSKASLIDDSLAYSRLITLFMGSLYRYLAPDMSKDVIDDVIVCGRAVCHAVVTSPEPQEAIKRLSDQLEESSILAQLEGVEGELLLVLMCSFNHPRFWLNTGPEKLESLFNGIDTSTLPIYITAISIASLTFSGQNHGIWILKLAEQSLSRSPSPKIIGLAARSLESIVRHDKKILEEFWGAYSRDDDYVSSVSAALSVYSENIRKSKDATLPACITAYTALIRASLEAITELFNDTPDSLYPREARNKRALHRKKMATPSRTGSLSSGQKLLMVLENTLIDASDQLKALSVDQQPLLEELWSLMLQVLKALLLNSHWPPSFHLEGTACWSAAATLDLKSEHLPVILDLMRHTRDIPSEYIKLFRLYPPVASVISLALKSDNADLRNNSLSLLHDKSRVWFKEPAILQRFADAKLHTSLACYVQTGNTMRHKVISLITALAPVPWWRTQFLDAFYGIAVSISHEYFTNKHVDIVQLSLDTWFELDHETSYRLEGTDRNWHSSDMLEVVAEFALHWVKLHRTHQYQPKQPMNVGIPRSLKAYLDRYQVVFSGNLPNCTEFQLGTFAALVALMSNSTVDTNYFDKIQKAFRLYRTNIGNVPAFIETYSSLIKGFVMALTMLSDPSNNVFPQEVRARHQEYLRISGYTILVELENILIDASDRIQALSVENNALHLQYEFRSRILEAIKTVVANRFGGSDFQISGRACWRAAAVLGLTSEDCLIILDLMHHSPNHQGIHVVLFNEYPYVASFITVALSSDNPIVREGSLSLLLDNAEVWFKDQAISEHFLKADLATNLASLVEMGDTRHDQVKGLVGLLAPLPQWSSKFLDAFYDVTVSIDRDHFSEKSLGIIRFSLDMWLELTRSSDHPKVTVRNWHSYEMLGLISEYLVHRVNVYKTLRSSSSSDWVRIANARVEESLQEYISRLEAEHSGDKQSGMIAQKLAEVFEEFKGLLPDLST